MPDICTLVILMTVTAQACYAPVQCGDVIEGRKFCSGGYPTACPPPPPFYECKREDGTSYQLDYTRGPTTIANPNNVQD